MEHAAQTPSVPQDVLCAVELLLFSITQFPKLPRQYGQKPEQPGQVFEKELRKKNGR